MTLASASELSQHDGASATALLAQFAAELKYDALPNAVVDHTKLTVLDTIGVALAGAAVGEGCEGVLAYAMSQSQGGDVRIWGSDRRMPPGLGAFCNACHARCLDYDDIIENPQIHVGVSVIPAAFAVAESLGRPVTGKSLLTAVAAGCEVQSRLAASIAPTHDSSTFPVVLATQVFGYFSAAVAAGRLLGLNQARMESAIGLAMMHAAGTEEMVVHSPHSVGKCIYAGFSNQGGVQSALMAAHGVPAMGAALEGKAGLFAAYYGGRYDRGALIDGLGKNFAALERCFKASPGTLVGHAFTEAALIILLLEHLAPDDITHIQLHVGSWGRAMCEPIDARRHPPTAAAAMNSIPFVVAKAIVNGHVTLTDFQATGRQQSACQAMADRITYIYDPKLDNPLGLEPGFVEITTADGRLVSERVDKPRGHPSRPLGFDDMARKFRENAAYATAFTPERVDEIIFAVERLEHSEDIRHLVDLLTPETRRAAV